MLPTTILSVSDSCHAAHTTYVARSLSPDTHAQPGRLTRARLLPLTMVALALAACGSGNQEEPRGLSGTSQSSVPVLQGTSTVVLNDTLTMSNDAAGITGDAALAARNDGLTDDLAFPGEQAGTMPVSSNTRQTKAVTTGTVDVCRAIIAQNRKLPSGPETALIPGIARPAFGEAVQDPVYGSCLTRVTDNGGGTKSEPYRRADYSRRQAFNLDSTYMLMQSMDGYWYLHDAKTLKPIRLLKGITGDAEPQWHPYDRNRVYFLGRNGIGMQIRLLDVRNNWTVTAADMSKQVQSIWPNANAAWTRSEGSPSQDGRYWCFQAEDTRTWRTVGVFTWDMKEQRIVGSMDMNERPDHVSMSPSGYYCVVSSDGPMGTRSYTRDFKKPYFNNGSTQPWLQLHHKSEHSDIALDKNLVDAYVSVNYSTGEVFSVNLVNGRRTSLFNVYGNRTATALHFSGKAYDKPGWVLVSTYGAYYADNMSANIRNTSRQQWHHRKMFAVSIEAKPKIRPIAHVDSNSVSAPGMDAYWTEPQATVNPDFTRMLFNSTWNSTNAYDVETYLAAIPGGALDR